LAVHVDRSIATCQRSSPGRTGAAACGIALGDACANYLETSFISTKPGFMDPSLSTFLSDFTVSSS
jgi:hypothetical protein